MTEQLKFKTGDWVRWTSEARGYPKLKVGRVVAFIPVAADGRALASLHDPDQHVGPGRCHFNHHSNQPRYLVRVDPEPKKPGYKRLGYHGLLPRWYAPNVAVLERTGERVE